MSLGTEIAAALPGLRAAAESMHRDTFAVYRNNGGTTTDPVTLEERPTFDTVHASVMGKFQFTDLRPSDAAIPGQVLIETSMQWHTSINTLGVLTGDEVECTVAVSDPELFGTRVRVAGPFLKSIATARRFPVVEVS